MPRSWSYTESGLLQPLDAAAPIDPGTLPPPPPPPGPTPPPTDKLWWVGFSRSVTGLSGSLASKKTATLERVQQMADQIGMTAADLRSHTMWHYYNSGTPDWNAPSTSGSAFYWTKEQGFKGLVCNMKTQDLSGWASGALDDNFRTYLSGLQSHGYKVLVLIEHEPENNGWTAAQVDLWCKGTARFMKMVYELNDPNIYYGTCYIANPTGLSRSYYNPIPALQALVGTTQASKIVARTLCGFDPYPMIKKDGSIQYIRDFCSAAMNDYKKWGFTRFYLPEVGFYNWNDTNGLGPLTAAQQAKRIYDELWTWAKANAFEGYCYFDVTDVNNARGDSRTLETAQEQLQYAKLILNQA